MSLPLSEERAFRRLWAAQSIAAVGARVTRTVLPLMAILIVGASAWEVALLAALQAAPAMAVGLLLGGTVDRRGKRRLLVGCDLARAAAVLSLPAAAWLGEVTVLHLALVSVVVGACAALFDLADNAWLPSLVGRDRLVEANSKLNATGALAEIAGPPLGGALMQALTAPVALVADGVSGLASAALVAGIRAPDAPAVDPAGERGGTRGRLLADAVDGARASWREPLVRPLVLLRASNAFFGGFFLALYAVFCVIDVGLAPVMLGAVIGAGGVGALVGALAAGREGGAGRLGTALVVSALLAEVAALALPAAAWAPSHLLAVGLLVTHQVVSDGFRTVAWTLEASVRQGVLPGAVLGRATGALNALLAGLLPLGALVAGALAEATSVRVAVLVGILGGLTGPLAVALSRPLRTLRRLPTACAAAGAAVLREYREDDFAAVAGLWLEAFGRVRPEDARERLHATWARNPGLFLVAEKDGRVVGTVLGTHDGRRAYLAHVAVAASERRGGIGTALIREAERRIFALGLDVIHLRVDGANATAIAFYESLGWTRDPPVLGMRTARR